MEGFKPFKKVQCFKEGGSVQKEVNFTKRDRKNVEPNDMAQDKKLVKKAFLQHDKAKHGGSEATEIKLKKGGRAKKDCGTVKKYKTGGVVENAYGAKKTDKDIKDIANSKRQKPALLCGGKSVKKMADGGILDTLRDNVMGTPAQNATASQKEREYLRAKMAQKAAGAKLGAGEEMAMSLAGAGQKLQPVPMPSAPQGAQTAPMPQPSIVPRGALSGLTPMKKGGKAKKACK
jgi:hypothetical protein